LIDFIKTAKNTGGGAEDKKAKGEKRVSAEKKKESGESRRSYQKEGRTVAGGI